MSLDKFKNIKTKIDIPTDADYSKKLASLPEHKHKMPVLATLSTVAAVLVIAVAVGMWAIIGRGVRNGGEAAPPAAKTQVYTLTDEIKTQLKDLYINHLLFYMDDFDEKKPLTAEQIVTYLTDINHDIIYDSLTREEFSQFAKDTFNLDVTIPEDIDDITPAIYDVDYIVPEPISISVTDGVAKVVYEHITTREAVRFKLTEDKKFHYFVGMATEIISNVTMTDRVRNALESLYMEHYMFLLEDFDEDNPLTAEQILKYCEDSNWEKYDFDLTREEFSQFAKEKFGSDITIPEDLNFETNKVTNHHVASSEPISMTVEDGVVTVKYLYINQLTTVRYRYKNTDPLNLDCFLSFKRETTEVKTEEPSEKTLENILKEYHFDRIHPFEEGELPYYMRYHVSAFVGAENITQYTNKKGGFFLGIPLDVYNETARRLYGRSDMEGKTEHIDFKDQEGYLKYADLVQLPEGGLCVALELSGGLEVDYEIIDYTVDGQRVTVKFRTYQSGTEPKNYSSEITTVTYRSYYDLTPDTFLSCQIATSEPLAPKDGEKYMSESEFLAYLPHLAFDAEYDADGYAWAEDDSLSENMTYNDMYVAVLKFVKKYYFHNAPIKDVISLTEENANTLVPYDDAIAKLGTLDQILVPENVTLNLISYNYEKCTVNGAEQDMEKITDYFNNASVKKIAYNADMPKNHHQAVFNCIMLPAIDYTVPDPKDVIYFSDDWFYVSGCLYTVEDGYFSDIL